MTLIQRGARWYITAGWRHGNQHGHAAVRSQRDARSQGIGYDTDKGWVVMNRAGIFAPGRGTIRAADVAQVIVSGHDRQYVTGARAAGVVLTGGVALLAPARMRARW